MISEEVLVIIEHVQIEVRESIGKLRVEPPHWMFTEPTYMRPARILKCDPFDSHVMNRVMTSIQRDISVAIGESLSVHCERRNSVW